MQELHRSTTRPRVLIADDHSLVAEGKEVADILKVSDKTVMFHEYQIMQSFNLKNNADLVLFALKRHLISSD